MLIGIIKNNIEIFGDCKVTECINGGNKTISVICKNHTATIYDKIIFTCEDCKNKISINKRVFFRKPNYKQCLCGKCQAKQTFISKYGVSSPNMDINIKRKQHPNWDSNLKPQNRKKMTTIELKIYRSQIAKQLWNEGVYDHLKLSEQEKTKIQQERKLKKRKTKVIWKEYKI